MSEKETKENNAKKDVPKKEETRFFKMIENALATPLERRSVLKGMVVAGAAVVGTAEATSTIASKPWLQKFFQGHYKELTAADKEKVFARIIQEIKEDHGVDVTVSDPPPIAGTHFVYCLDLSKCNGNRACVEACVIENNLDRSMAYIKVLEMKNGGYNFEDSDRYYGGMVPKPDNFYLPVACNQCDNAPCVKACPIQATWKEPDGIVVIDYDWCIGCRYCQAACPYEARHFNWKTPEIPKDEINLNQSYLSNRIRPRGVIEKCTFCLHRTRVGKFPACMEACPTGARIFGNLADPESEVAAIFKMKKVFVLKEEMNTKPRFFYYFD